MSHVLFTFVLKVACLEHTPYLSCENSTYLNKLLPFGLLKWMWDDFFVLMFVTFFLYELKI